MFVERISLAYNLICFRPGSLGQGASFESATDEDFLSLLNQSFSSHPHYDPPNAEPANPVPAHSFRYVVF